MSSKNNCLVVGTISSIKTLQKICNDSNLASNAQILEIRLNENMHDQNLYKYIEQLRKKWQILITIRTHKEGGKWQINDHDRYKIFQRFFNYADYFDIELESDLFSHFSRQKFPEQIKIITSYHNYDKTLTIKELQHKIEKGMNWGADIIKLALKVNSSQDIDKLEEILQINSSSLCIIAMGKLGQISRYSFAKLGSKLTYGFLDESVAPGQLSCKKLAKLLQEN